MLKVSDVRTQ